MFLSLAHSLVLVSSLCLFTVRLYEANNLRTLRILKIIFQRLANYVFLLALFFIHSSIFFLFLFFVTFMDSTECARQMTYMYLLP